MNGFLTTNSFLVNKKMIKNNSKTKENLLELYLKERDDIDTWAVEEGWRIQKRWHHEKLENALIHLDLEGKKVLDLACGSGGLTRKIKERNPSARIYGVDFNKKAIEYAARKDAGVKGVKYFSGDAQDIPFRDKFFDVVIGFDMLDHIPDYRKCMSEIRRVLKDGGEIAVTVENHHSLWPIVEFAWSAYSKFGNARNLSHQHVVNFTPKTFKELIAKSGFLIKKFYTIHNVNTFFYLISDWYPKALDSFICRRNLGLSLFCYAKKIKCIPQ